MWNYGGHMAWMWVWWLLGLTLLGVIIWAVARTAAPHGPAGDDSPEAILKRRYARGELNRDEYEQRLKDLRM